MKYYPQPNFRFDFLALKTGFSVILTEFLGRVVGFWGTMTGLYGVDFF
jgi:hypothetical protein